MSGRVWARVRPAILWEYRRGSWQYDIIVALILAVIFLIPRSWFNDRPSAPVFHEVGRADETTRVFWIDPGALDRANPESAESRMKDLLRTYAGEDLQIVRAEPARDQAGNVRAYVVYARK